MTFREFKANGGEYDYMVLANDAGSFGRKGSTAYGYTPAMEDWEIAKVEESVDFWGKTRITIHIVYQ